MTDRVYMTREAYNRKLDEIKRMEAQMAEIAEKIENVARSCIETHRFPDELIPDVVALRKMFERTLELFDKATNPLLSRASGGFGRKVANQDFGRI